MDDNELIRGNPTLVSPVTYQYLNESYLMKWYLLIFVLAILSSCTDEECGETTSEDCIWQENINRIFDRKKEDPPCTYFEVYKLDGELFTLCYCCVCDKAWFIFGCDGSDFCERKSGCIEDFLDEAEYQYSFE